MLQACLMKFIVISKPFLIVKKKILFSLRLVVFSLHKLKLESFSYENWN